MVKSTRSTEAILEISRSSDGGLPASLISAAYRASRRMRIWLVLNAVSPAEVDAVLDRVVREDGYDGFDVRYVRGADAAIALYGNDVEPHVFALSADLRSRLVSHGIAVHHVSDAEAFLAQAVG